MDFSLTAFVDAFKSAEYVANHTKFMAFAFILATPADPNVFPDLLAHYGDLNELTADYILVIAPHVHMNKSPNVSMTPEEISQVLATKRFYNYYEHEYRDVSGEIDWFLQKQTAETYKFARFIGISENEIPCIAFFDTLASTEKYIRWSLQGTTASDVVKDFRLITSALRNAKSKEQKSDVLSIINTLDKKRFVVKAAKEIGKAIPTLTSFFTG